MRPQGAEKDSFPSASSWRATHLKAERDEIESRLDEFLVGMRRRPAASSVLDAEHRPTQRHDVPSCKTPSMLLVDCEALALRYVTLSRPA